MRSTSLNSRKALSAHNIFNSCNRFEMIWTDTKSIPTQMINGQITGYWSNFHFVNKSVCSPNFSTWNINSISVDLGPDPIPARISLLHFSPKSLAMFFRDL